MRLHEGLCDTNFEEQSATTGAPGVHAHHTEAWICHARPPQSGAPLVRNVLGWSFHLEASLANVVQEAFPGQVVPIIATS